MSNTNIIKRAHLALTKISPASWIYHILGSLLVASPAEIKQAPHFWFDNEDRPLPDAGEYNEPVIQLSQVAGDDFRRRLRKGLAWHTFVVSSALCIAIYVIGLGLVKVMGPDKEEAGASGVVSGWGTAAPKSCAELERDFNASLAARGNPPITGPDSMTPNEKKIVSQATSQNCRF